MLWPRKETGPETWWDSDITTADQGMRPSAMPIEVTGWKRRPNWVMGTTPSITTSGLTLAYHSGLACAPTVRSTYFGMEA